MDEKFISHRGIRLGSLVLNWWGVALLVSTFFIGWHIFVLAVVYLTVLMLWTKKGTPHG